MNGYLTRLVRGGLITLLAVALLAIGGTAFGAYEVSEYDPDLPENGGAAQWTEDFTVQWESPTLNGLDQLVGFAYKWNDSENALTYPSYDVNNYDGFIDDAEAPYFASLTAAEIAGDDSDNLRYLHIQTVYLANGIPPFALSSDVVIGPFNIDNTVSGTFRLPDPDNTDQDLVQTRNPQVTLAVGAPSDVAALYIGETSTFASAAQYPAGTTSYTLSDTTAGAKTIYLWIEDQAGNRSAIPLSASFTLLDPASVSPFTATIDLADTDTKTFTISASSGYNWDVINEKDADGQLADVGTIAIIAGNETDVTSVTVQALLPGSFQLQAVPNGGGESVESGVVSVIQSRVFVADIDNNSKVEALTDGLLVMRYLFNYPTFFGDAWITGVVAGDAIRTDAGELEAYIADGVTNLELDIDGNGKVESLTDGLLLMRYLFNYPTFFGESWITGVVASDATRTTAADIAGYIETIMP